jgi:hypothetical protein
MIQLAHYLSGRRVYKALYGERAPKAPEIASMWKGLEALVRHLQWVPFHGYPNALLI